MATPIGPRQEPDADTLSCACVPPTLRRGEAFTCACGTRWQRMGASTGRPGGWLELSSEVKS
jgi:hypothetical protein